MKRILIVVIALLVATSFSFAKGTKRAKKGRSAQNVNPYIGTMPRTSTVDAADENDGKKSEKEKTHEVGKESQTDEDTEEIDNEEQTRTDTLDIKKAKSSFFVSCDFGLNHDVNNYGRRQLKSNNFTWAFSGNFCRDLVVFSASNKLLLTYGAELRSYNATFSYSDDFNETGYNNYHFWYAGVPVSVIYIDNKTMKSGLYAQAQIIPAYKLAVSNVVGDQGTKTTKREDNAYHSVIISGSISAGMIIRMNKNALLAGPFLNTSFTNVSAASGIKEHLISYGLSLSYFLN